HETARERGRALVGPARIGRALRARGAMTAEAALSLGQAATPLGRGQPGLEQEPRAAEAGEDEQREQPGQAHRKGKRTARGALEWSRPARPVQRLTWPQAPRPWPRRSRRAHR